MSRKKAHNEDKEPFLENILSILRFHKIFNYIDENSKILDLGCGYGAKFIKKIQSEKNCECFGIDISVDENISSDKITLINHDLNNRLPFEDNSFNVVVSLANLEHLNDPRCTLREINRVLKQNGRLLLTTPSIYAKPVLEFLSYNLHLISENEIRDHKNYFNRKMLMDMLKKAGFSSIEHKYFQLFMNNFVKAAKK